MNYHYTIKWQQPNACRFMDLDGIRSVVYVCARLVMSSWSELDWDFTMV